MVAWFSPSPPPRPPHLPWPGAVAFKVVSVAVMWQVAVISFTDAVRPEHEANLTQERGVPDCGKPGIYKPSDKDEWWVRYCKVGKGGAGTYTFEPSLEIGKKKTDLNWLGFKEISLQRIGGLSYYEWKYVMKNNFPMKVLLTDESGDVYEKSLGKAETHELCFDSKKPQLKQIDVVAK
eukprot:gb/GFBE01006180.1/.p1 GENE.gb/GFBE01006180.1/~~gb/GFBE01006180.1/.p1  ORF type:complete len:178 (+),score=23.76 gb/GFBE01006180.1/:1-534(+)